MCGTTAALLPGLAVLGVYLLLRTGHVMSLAGAFVPCEPRRPVADIAESVGIYLELDLLLTVASMLVCCSINCAELRRVGADGVPILKSIGLLVAGSVLLKPGAAFVAFWKWREMKMARSELRTSDLGCDGNTCTY